MRLVHKASAIWQGNKRNGEGVVKPGPLNTGCVALNFSSGQSIRGATNPEELLAAAHLSCFLIHLLQELERNGFRELRLRTHCALSTESLESGWTVSAVHLAVIASLPESYRYDFLCLARRSAAHCMTGRLLKARLNITVDMQSIEEFTTENTELTETTAA